LERKRNKNMKDGDEPMKYKIPLYVLLFVFIVTGNGLATNMGNISGNLLDLGTNITISDTVFTGSDWYSDREDQEVEPNCLTGQVWDLEGFFLNGSTMFVVGGYDFKDGYPAGVNSWDVGDIFFDTDGDAIYGVDAQGSGGDQSYPIVNNDIFKYNYALRLNFLDYTYNLYTLDSNSTLRVFFNQNDESNPWRYVEDGQTPYTSGDFNFYEGLNDDQVAGLQGGDGSHYAIEFTLPFVIGDSFIAHLTYECGNDNMMASVPDAGIMWLLGPALLSLGLLGRRRKSKK
jgi:hypothetical protein